MTSNRPFTLFAAIILLAMAVLHIYRLFTHFQVIIGSHVIGYRRDSAADRTFFADLVDNLMSTLAVAGKLKATAISARTAVSSAASCWSAGAPAMAS